MLTAEEKQLADFYQVTTLSELVKAQAYHVEKLQKRLQEMPPMKAQLTVSGRVREG